MRKTPLLALTFLAALGLTAVETPDADAARGGTRTARTTTPRQSRNATRTRARAASAQTASRSRANPLKSVNHLAKVKTEVNQWTKWTLEGKPGSGGNYDFHAAFANVITAEGTATQVRAANYGKHPQKIKVSGVKDGTWRGTLIGTVSVHDLASLSNAKYAKAVKDRVAADRVKVSYDYGPGTPVKVVASKVKSDVVTAVPLEIPLNPKKSGVTRVMYERTNASGTVVGGVSGYAEGRIIEIVQ